MPNESHLLSEKAFAFDPEDASRIVRDAISRGLICGPHSVLPVKKQGSVISDQDGITAQMVEVTPSMASQWLKNNKQNRRINKTLVRLFAREIINGNWLPTHQGIAFNDKDELIDGQHRLEAIILSDMPAKIMVTYGLPSKIDGKEITTMDVVDRGKTRSISDQLTIQHGIKNSSVTASVCAVISNLCYGQKTKRLSVANTLEIFREFEKAITWVVEKRSKEKGLKCAGVLAAFAFAIASDNIFLKDPNKSKIACSYLALIRGDKLPPKSPIKHLRDFLVSPASKLFSRGTDRGIAEMVLQAINLEVNGRKCSELTCTPDGINYFRNAQPDRVSKIAAIFNSISQ